MTYTSGENAILTRIQAHSDWTSANTSQADWGILNSGVSNHYAILRPGEPAEPEYITFTVYRIAWNTVIEVWQRYTTEEATVAALVGYANGLVTQMQPYRRLGLSNVQKSEVTSIGTPTKMLNQDGGPAWLKQEINIRWLDQVGPVTYV